MQFQVRKSAIIRTTSSLLVQSKRRDLGSTCTYLKGKILEIGKIMATLTNTNEIIFVRIYFSCHSEMFLLVEPI